MLTYSVPTQIITILPPIQNNYLSVMIVCSLRKYKDGIEYPHRKVISPWQIVRININQIKSGQNGVCVYVHMRLFVCEWKRETERWIMFSMSVHLYVYF